MAELTVLTGDASLKAEGQFVLDTQTLATEQGFRNVSKMWYDKTIDFNAAREIIQSQIDMRQDIPIDIVECKFVNVDNHLHVKMPDGRVFKPNEHSVAQLATKIGIGTSTVLTYSGVRPNEDIPIDHRDINIAIRALNQGIRRMKSKEKFDGRELLLRTYTDGTLRAVLTPKYAIVDNRWVLDTLESLIPGGRVSHFEFTDADELDCNILIPDSIRVESDSEYGGMYKARNSEIGTSSISCLASIYRAVCRNGCIWGKRDGIAVAKRHLGEIDLNVLKEKLRTNIDAQIPLFSTKISTLVSTRAWVNVATIQQIFCEVANTYKLGKEFVSHAVAEWNTHGKENNAFGVIDALTRAGQDFNSKVWNTADIAAGDILNGGSAGWERINNRAATVSDKEIVKLLF